MVHARGRGHYSLSVLGVCRYLDNVSEVFAHVFFVYTQSKDI